MRGVDFVPHFSFAEYDAAIGAAPELIVIPFLPYEQAPEYQAIMEWVRAHAGERTLLLSICAGAKNLADTGLLAGRSATTHHYTFPVIEKAHPDVKLVRGVRYVEDGNVISSAGVTAGVDATLGPLESPVEHGGSRTQYAHLIEQSYRAEYEALFGPLPDLSDAARFPAAAGPVVDPAARVAWEQMTPADREAITRVYANIGKAIAAYERKLMPGPSRFDQYVEALLDGDTATMREALAPDEVAGLRLFVGKAGCIRRAGTAACPQPDAAWAAAYRVERGQTGAA